MKLWFRHTVITNLQTHKSNDILLYYSIPENLGDPGNLQSGNNSSFFNVVPAGFLYDEGYGGEGETAVFWSSSLDESNTNLVWFRAISNFSPNVSRESIDLIWGFSVRFVKD